MVLFPRVKLENLAAASVDTAQRVAAASTAKLKVAEVLAYVELTPTTDISIQVYRESFFINNPLFSRDSEYIVNPYFEFIDK